MLETILKKLNPLALIESLLALWKDHVPEWIRKPIEYLLWSGVVVVIGWLAIINDEIAKYGPLGYIAVGLLFFNLIVWGSVGYGRWRSLRHQLPIDAKTNVYQQTSISPSELAELREELSSPADAQDKVPPAIGRAIIKILDVVEERLSQESEITDYKLRAQELETNIKILQDVLSGLDELKHRSARLADRSRIASALLAECASALICKDLRASLPRPFDQTTERTAEELIVFVNDANNFVNDVMIIARLAQLWYIDDFNDQLYAWSNKAEKEFHDDHRGTSLPVEMSTARRLYAIASKRLAVTDRFLSGRELSARQSHPMQLAELRRLEEIERRMSSTQQ